MEQELRVIISGGGTGGHIFPAISIANAIKAKRPDAKLLFVGALGRMEMQRVPAAGYEIKGLPIAGFDRKHLLKNVVVLYKIWKSQRMARKIIRDFKPMVAVGVGGLIQEQNSYAGVTNKLLSKKASKICVAYEGMERFFPAEKIILTGNPVRQNVLNVSLTKAEARAKFGLDEQKKTILLVGGSLGAHTLNDSMLNHLDVIKNSDVQFIWQTGKFYYQHILQQLEGHNLPNLKVMDLVISRAGASSISEFCLIGKAVILVPSPNVAEDHQTKNAMALVNRSAAIYVKDSEAPDVLLSTAIGAVHDDEQLKHLEENILKLGLNNAADVIADEVIRLALQ